MAESSRGPEGPPGRSPARPRPGLDWDCRPRMATLESARVALVEVSMGGAGPAVTFRLEPSGSGVAPAA